MPDCIFCKIIDGSAPSHKIWEDDEFMAILSIFPNTEGFSVVFPKTHHPSYAFDLSDETLSRLMIASKKVAKLLDNALDNVGRTGLFLEGFGVDHVHSKLFPMHGTRQLNQNWQPVKSTINTYFDTYQGYISSHDSHRADDAQLELLAQRIRKAAETR